MLVLSRKLGEKIHIGPDITVTVVDIDRGKIRLGIDAPRDVQIYRPEYKPPEQPPPRVGSGAGGRAVLRAEQARGGDFVGWWYVCDCRGYLWPDGLFRIFCFDVAAGGKGGYYPAKELADSAALNHKAAHAPEAARRAEPC